LSGGRRHAQSDLEIEILPNLNLDVTGLILSEAFLGYAHGISGIGNQGGGSEYAAVVGFETAVDSLRFIRDCYSGARNGRAGCIPDHSGYAAKARAGLCKDHGRQNQCRNV